MSHATSVLVRAAWIAVCLQAWSSAAAVTLVQDGKTAGVIVTAKFPTPAARLAALELQFHLEETTGAVLPIVAPGAAAGRVRILVGESAATRELGLKGEDFKPQEYLIRISDDTIVLMGRDWQDTEAIPKPIAKRLAVTFCIRWPIPEGSSTTAWPWGGRQRKVRRSSCPAFWTTRERVMQHTTFWSVSALSAGTAPRCSTS
jgi:hypothetical protein